MHVLHPTWQVLHEDPVQYSPTAQTHDAAAVVPVQAVQVPEANVYPLLHERQAVSEVQVAQAVLHALQETLVPVTR